MPPPAIQVLLIEDSLADALFLRTALEKDHLNTFALTETERLNDGLAWLTRQAFDIVLLDLGLPDSHGLATFERLHQQAPDMPVVVFSGNIDERDAVEAVRAGAQDYLVKGPASFDLAARTIRYAIERQKLALSLRRREEQYRFLLDNTSDFIARFDRNGTMIFGTEASLRFNGYRPEEIINTSAFERIHPDDWDNARTELERVLASGDEGRVEYRVRHKNGDYLWVEAVGTRVLSAAGEPEVIVVQRDITARKLAEEKLRESEKRFSTAFFTSPVSQSILSQATGLIMEVNDNCCDLYGYSRAELIGGDPGQLDLWANPAEQLTVIAELQKSGHLLPTEVAIRRKSGEIRTVLFAVEPLTWQGAPCLITSSVDITERKHAEEKLRDSEARFHSTLEAMQEGVLLLGKDWRYLYINKSAETQGRRPAEELLGKTVMACWPGIETTDFFQLEQKVMEERLSAQIEGPYTFPTGETRWFYWNIQPAPDGLLIVTQDITERKQMEQKLIASEVLLRQVLESIPGSIFALDRGYRFLVDNQYHQQELVASGGHPFVVGEPMLSPNYPAEVLEFWRAAYDRTFTGEVFNLEGSWEDVNGRSHIHENRFSPLRDASGAIIGALVVAYDITERRQTENALRESEKRFSTLFRSNPVPVGITHSPDYCIVDVNDAWSDLTGYGREEALGHTATELGIVVPESLQQIRNMLQTQGEIRQHDLLLRTRSGQERRILITSEPFELGGETYIFNNLLDITERKQAEQELRESEERLEMVMEGSQLGYWDWNIETGQVSRNARWAEMLGYTLEEVEFNVKQWTDLHHPDDREAAWKSIQDHLDGKTPAHRIEYRMRAKDGQYRWILDQARVVKRNAQGKPLRMSGTHTDITERKQAEERLRESEERFSTIFRTSPIGIILTRMSDGHVIEANDAFLHMFGYCGEEVAGKTTLALGVYANPDDRQRLVDMLHATGRLIEQQTQFRKKSGDIGDLLISAEAIELMGECYLLSMMIDVTARKQAEEKLRESEQQLRALVTSLDDIVFEVDEHGTYRNVWTANDALLFQPRHQIIGRRFDEIFGAEASRPFFDALERVLASGEAETVEYPIGLADAQRWFAARYNIIQASDRTTGTVSIMVRDITERKQAELALQKNERILRLFVEHSPAAIAMFDREMRYIVHSQRYLTDYRLGEQILVGRSHYDVFPEMDEGRKETHRRCLAGEVAKCEEDLLPRTDGTQDWVRYELRPWYEANGEIGGLIFFSEVITERKRAEEALRASEVRFRALIENAPGAVTVIGADGCLIYVSSSTERVMGYRPEDVLGKNPATLTHPDDLPNLVEILSDLIQHPGEVRQLQYRFQHQNGSWRWIESLISNLLHEPSVNGIAFNFQDITERKQAEAALQKNEALLSEAQRLGQIGHWEWFAPGQTMICSDELLRILEIEQPDHLISQESITKMVEPSEVKRVQELEANAFASRSNLDYEYRIHLPDGRWRWLHQLAQVFYDEAGSPIRMIGVIQDVTERKQAEEIIRHSSEQLAAMVDIEHALAATLSQEAIYKALQDGAQRLFPDIATLFISSFDPQRQRIKAEYGVHDGELVEVARLPEILLGPAGQGTQSQVVHTRQPLLIHHDLKEQFRQGAPMTHIGSDDHDTQSALYVPMLAQDEVLGIIQLQSYEPGRFSEEDVRALSLVANTAAVSIQNARLYERAQTEIAERTRIEAELRQSETQYRYLFENNPHPMWAYDLRTLKFLAVNDAAVDKYGYSRDEFLHMTIAQIRPRQEVDRLVHHIEKQRPALQHSGEWQHKLKDGTIIDVEISSHTIELEGRQSALVVAMDITERKKAQAALAESERRLRTTIETTSDGFWIVDSSGRFRDVNPAYCSISGYSREEFLAKNISDIEVIENPAETAARIQKILQTGSDRFETIHRRKDGSTFDAEVSVNLLDRASGLMVCFLRDITERQRAETQLRQRMEDLALINKLNDAMNHGESLVTVTELLAADAKTIFGSLSASIYLLDPSKQNLILQHFTMPSETVKRLEKVIGRTVPKIDLPIGGDDHFSRVLASDEGVIYTGFEAMCAWLGDFANTRYFPKRVRSLIRKVIPAAARLLNINSVMSVPLKAGTDVLGIIELTSESTFDETDLERFHNIHRQLTEIIVRKQIEENLRQSNERFIEIAENISEIFWIADPVSGKNLYVSPAFEKIVGMSYNDVQQFPEGFVELVVPEDRPILLATHQYEAFQRPTDVQYRIRRPDGSIHWLRDKSSPVYDETGKVVRVVGIARDITDQIEADARLRESEAHFRLIADTIEEVFWMSDPAINEMIYISPAYERVWGRSLQSLRDDPRSFIEAIHADDRSRVLAVLEKQSEGIQFNHEYRIHWPDGSLRWIWDRGYPVYDIAGKLSRYVGVAQDITERKQAETALQASEAQYRSLVEASDALIITLDADGRVIYANEKVNVYNNIHPSQAIGHTLSELLPEPIARRYMAWISQVIATNQGLVTETNPNATWYRTSLQPIRDIHGQAVMVLISATDITQLKTAQNELVELNRSLEERVEQRTAEVQDLYENAPTGYHSLDSNGCILMINQTELNWLGYTREELLGRHYTDLFTPDSLSTFRANFPGFKQRGWVRDLEFELVRKDGSILPVLVGATAIYDQNGAYLMSRSTVFDNTQRHKAEIALRESEEQNRLLFEAAPESVVLFDENGKLIRLNHAFELLTGYSTEQLASHTLDELSLLPREQIAQLASAIVQSFQTHTHLATAEFQLRRADGEMRDVGVSVFALQIQGRQHYLTTMRDISAHKQAEETLLRANLELERAMRLKDEFLASMSHELRTPLTGILGLSEVLQIQNHGALNEKQLRAVQNIETSGRHLLELINDILDLSKIEAGRFEIEFEPCSLGDICQSSLQLTKGMAQKKHLHVSFAMKPASIKLRADARRMKQMLVNLLSNAIKFTDDGGSLGLDVDGTQDEPVVRISVWDTGIGIKAEDLERLFQPFVQLDSSLARQYSGTGLGLSLVKRMVELHGGHIEVESTPGKGSRFTLVLPRLPDEATQPRTFAEMLSSTSPATPLVSGLSKQPVVMVVDDNEINVETLADFLETQQFRVNVAQSGQEFLANVETVRPNIILMDIQMPGLDGLEVIRRLRAHREPAVAKTPIIAITALAMPGDRERCLAAGADEYMSKPVGLQALAQMIRRFLHQSEILYG
jgi:PAS domain S-box-containing protein